MLILGLLGMYFDAAVVFVTNSSLLFRLAVAILCLNGLLSCNWFSNYTLLKKANKHTLKRGRWWKTSHVESSTHFMMNRLMMLVLTRIWRSKQMTVWSILFHKVVKILYPEDYLFFCTWNWENCLKWIHYTRFAQKCCIARK